MTDRQLPLFEADDGDDVPDAGGTGTLPDQSARSYAESPRNNVVLEASAGTGKTTVLVNRYLNLLRAGVDPSNVLAVTFTRKAAAEMRDRIITVLRRSALTDARDRVLWLALRNRLGDVSISTIDAFCYNLLREFPLEADLDPGFSLADETEIARLIEETLDHTLRVIRGRALRDDDLALLLAQLPPQRLRSGLVHLLSRRVVAEGALARYVAGTGRAASASDACRAHAQGLLALLGREHGIETFLKRAPRHPTFELLRRDVDVVRSGTDAPVTTSRAVIDGLLDCFLTKDKKPRARPKFGQVLFEARDDYEWHRDIVRTLAPDVEKHLRSLNRALNAVLARAMRQTLAIALAEYRRVLAEYDVLDFSEALTRAVRLLAQMDEFAQSRYRLESRYHHVLVDEFQDTSQLQWDLVSALVRSWGEGFGLVHEAPLPPTVFVVGDRKQSIYRFRDAEVAVLTRAGVEIAALRHEDTVRRWISTSFRSVPPLLAFLNALFDDVDRGGRDDAFRYEEPDRFPVSGADADTFGASPVVGLVAQDEPAACAASVAAEVARLLAEGDVRDPQTGLTRRVRPKDVAILFRSRESHREFERALERRGVPTYVYKGLGFFDADEVRDVTALMRYLAAPSSNLRAAAFLRSRLVGLSDPALARLAPHLATALTAPTSPDAAVALAAADAERLSLARASVAAWLPLVDRLPPAELVDLALATSAYSYEMRGPRRLQARENLKKLRALIRRIQNRGYASLARIADHVERLSAGDESNAVLDALDAVSLMTIHAAKGLEFPVVFLVNLSRGVGAFPPAIRVLVDGGLGEPVVGVSPYADEAAEEERGREREETKRLLYVAATRARDLLYFASLTRDGVFKPAPGSLGEVLPQSLGALFGVAARHGAAGEAVAVSGVAEWTSRSGQVFTFRLCPSQTAPRASAVEPDPRVAAEDPPTEEPLRPGARMVMGSAEDERWVRQRSVTDVLGDAGGLEAIGGDPLAALHGRLVHRLLARGVSTVEDALRVGRDIYVSSERLGLSDEQVAHVCQAAAEAALELRARQDVQSWCAEASSLFEVPFSALHQEHGEPVIVRGAIDWLLRWPDGRLAVVEVKTGSPRDSHQRQLELYMAAARALSPGASVMGHLLYAGRRG